MKITKAVSRFTVSLLCAVLIVSSFPVLAAGPSEELRHEAFVRGGNAISAALNAENAPVVSKAIEEGMPASPPPPAPRQAATKSATSSNTSMSKPMWALLIGGFVASGIVIYKVAAGPGASIRNCSTCTK